MTHDLVIKYGTIVSPEIGSFQADLGVEDELIKTIAIQGSLEGKETVDAEGRFVLPGVIDPHTHHGVMLDIESDAESESRSGLVGGVTTIGNIYRSGKPYTEILDDLLKSCEQNYYHDYFLTLAPFSSTHLEELPDLINQGITSFKWYMRFKHRAKELFDSDRDLLDSYADELIRLLTSSSTSTTLACHSENAEITGELAEQVSESSKNSYQCLIDAFPDYAETQGLVSAASSAQVHDFDDRLYAVHISAGRTADELASLHKIGYSVIGETCPKYLVLTADECDKRMAARPPIRSERDQQILWKRIADGTIQCIGTDHVMKPYDRKIGDNYWSTETAFPGSATMLPLLLSHGVNEDRISLERVVELTSTNNAKAYNLYPQKGSLQVGTHADLTIVDIDLKQTVTPELCQSAATYTPYEGMEVTGWPTQTIVRGQLAFDQGEIVGERGFGTHLERPLSQSSNA